MINKNQVDKALSSFKNTLMDTVMTGNADLIGYAATSGYEILNELSDLMIQIHEAQEAGKMVVGIHPEQ